MTVRGLSMGLMTVLGAARRGFFIPYRYADRLPPRGRHEPYGAVKELFAAQSGVFMEVLDLIDKCAAELKAIGGAPPPQPRWNQDWFPRLDAAAAYALVRHHAPHRIVEVGSGHSTRFLARAVADGGLETTITAIDPAPRAAIAELPLTLVPTTVQRAGREIFRELGDGDMLLIDSSHVLMPGSDVDFLINRVLPDLPSGVFIHFHDVFLPWNYPAQWEWRGYNEQQALCALLLGGDYAVLFASHYTLKAMAERIMRTVVAELPLVEGAHETGLWLRKGGRGRAGAE